MSGHNDLGHGGHPDRVSAQCAGHPNLRWGFILRAGEIHIYTLPKGDTQSCGFPPGDLAQGGCEESGGVGKADSKLGEVGTPQRGFQKNFDLVGDEHEVTGLEIQIDAAGGVGDNQGIRPKKAEHPYGVGHLFIRIALVMVHSALHDGYRFAGKGAERQPPLVAGRGGGFKMRNLAVWHSDRVFHLIPQITQAGAQDHGNLGNKTANFGFQIIGALAILSKSEIHKILPIG
ncbi:hypothetical protein SDC9_62921 [bioreactor metagenome]|uniref:Uncharacterized protein n=1 Tax=bioreactor metagenome TaxID=1076179 RepID=A0A644XK23_9ZZZZ